MTAYNKNNSAVKRIMQEAKELAKDPSTDYSAAPLEDNLFDWHCTLRGPPGTEFEGGLYHFRIVLPAEYPFKAPSLMMLTPSGRFEVNTKICISFTNYHEELWQPAWGVRTAIIGLQGFFPLKGTAAVGVGSLETPASERRRLAKLSREWVCPHCKLSNSECLPDPPETSESSESRADNAGNVEAAAGSAEATQTAENPTGISLQTSTPDDTRVNSTLHSADAQQTSIASANGASATTPKEQEGAGEPSARTQQSHQHQQVQHQEIEKKSKKEDDSDRSGQRGGSANDESPRTKGVEDDDSSLLEARRSGVFEPSGGSSSSGHSLLTSLSQARSREEESEYENGRGVRQPEGAAVPGAGVAGGMIPTLSGTETVGTTIAYASSSSSSPSRRSLLLLDGAIAMLIVWAGALVTRKLL